jgi:putative glutamine amidotransferase
MARPIIGILTNSHMINDTYEVYGSGSINVEAVGDVCRC